MVRLLIVEDEGVIRNGIERHIPWKKLGVQEIRTAENAERGLEICKEYRPNIIISDINMPGMNGIELCKRLKELRPDSQIIFISGYSDKEYLMSAISLGALGYVEKPIAIDKLSEIVEQAVANIHKQAKHNESKLHQLLQMDADDIFRNREVLAFYDREVEQYQDGMRLGVVILKWKELETDIADIAQLFRQKVQDEKNGRWHLMSDVIDRNQMLFLVYGNEINSLVTKELSDWVPGLLRECIGSAGKWFVGVGDTADDITKLGNSFETAKSAMTALFYKGYNTSAVSQEAAKKYTPDPELESEEMFYRYVREKNGTKAIEYLISRRDRLIEGRRRFGRHIRNDYMNYCQIIRKNSNIINANEREEEIKDERTLDEIETIYELYDSLVGKVKQMLAEGNGDQKNVFVVQKVMQFIEDNISNRDLSIKLLADEVFLTPTYLSGLFKKNTGMTIGQYLTDVRVRKAKELLGDPQYKLYHVAELVGYEDANYFAKIFKKNTGMLPSEYRNKNMVN